MSADVDVRQCLFTTPHPPHEWEPAVADPRNPRVLYLDLATMQCPGITRSDDEVPTHGMCTACGSVEVRLVNATGTRDLTHIGEGASYPTGYGCEVCS